MASKNEVLAPRLSPMRRHSASLWPPASSGQSSTLGRRSNSRRARMLGHPHSNRRQAEARAGVQGFHRDHPRRFPHEAGYREARIPHGRRPERLVARVPRWDRIFCRIGNVCQPSESLGVFRARRPTLRVNDHEASRRHYQSCRIMILKRASCVVALDRISTPPNGQRYQEATCRPQAATSGSP
jgi:hypothetical protein